MAEPPRHVLSDPESAPPEPIPIPAEATEPAAVEATPRPAPAWALLVSVLLPGGGQLALGAWGTGVALLLSWGFLLAIAFLGRSRFFWQLPRATTQDYVAAGALFLTMALVWGWALWDLATAAARGARERGDSQWRIAARRFRKSRLAVAGVGIVGLLYAVALMAPLLAPYDPIAQPADIAANSYLGPLASGHLLGTDQFGRDVLSRIVFGARISLSIGFIATAISISLGTLIGAVAGYFGHRIDAALMRFTDMVLAFPRLVLLILIVALFSPSIAVIIAVLGLTQWPGTTRIVRGEVLSLREREYVQAARALGFGRARIIFRHLIPNVLAPVIVTATLGIGNTIVLEAGLSFLGLGVQAPTPSWGSMVADGRQNLIGAWWVATFPGLAIVLTVLAFNLVGDALRDALDPRLRT